MHYLRIIPLYFLLVTLPLCVFANPNHTQLAVWANEAIVATYTYSYENFIERQQKIAKYFTAKGWIAYSKAMHDAKLPESVQKNNYVVSAVALLPPVVKQLKDKQWQAKMPLLVLYKNTQYQQKQTLTITLTFTIAPRGQGVRGLAINSLEAIITQMPCRCVNEAHEKALA